MKRRELREHIFEILFRVEFMSESDMEEQLELFFEDLAEARPADVDYIKNKYLAVTVAAVVCPIVNTGIFLLGCVIFFMDTIRQWGAGAGFENVAKYLIVGMVGFNFLVELATNVILSPVAARLLSISKKLYK